MFLQAALEHQRLSATSLSEHLKCKLVDFLSFGGFDDKVANVSSRGGEMNRSINIEVGDRLLQSSTELRNASMNRVVRVEQRHRQFPDMLMDVALVFAV